MTPKKSPKMRAIEEQHNQALETLLPALINQDGFIETCGTLGISKAGLAYWLLKLGISVRRVALAPGETLEVKRIS